MIQHLNAMERECICQGPQQTLLMASSARLWPRFICHQHSATYHKCHLPGLSAWKDDAPVVWALGTECWGAGAIGNGLSFIISPHCLVEADRWEPEEKGNLKLSRWAVVNIQQHLLLAKMFLATSLKEPSCYLWLEVQICTVQHQPHVATEYLERG